ncbi:acyl-CoA carboxylase epsilon subunit [uncultured Gulosibacter sp.]|uniref:acyl-CoA carboxylase epsilon subunit n=1 Tax=uncultured Gulosibacter sp. TaxID=1339167 RepID=UPI0028898EBF|nr:acyl-CoA carboxylase epsilon subunit [uncultured Gulosibacter sp.]
MPNAKLPKIAIPDLDLSDSLSPGEARLLRGNPTDDELAAVAATLAVLFADGVQVDRPRDAVVKLTPWQLSQRALRGGGGSGDPFGGRYKL